MLSTSNPKRTVLFKETNSPLAIFRTFLGPDDSCLICPNSPLSSPTIVNEAAMQIKSRKSIKFLEIFPKMDPAF